MDPKERKRTQNRIAQRTYRRNQKERIRSLELAASHRIADTKPQMPITPATSDSSRMWISPINEDFPSSLELPDLDLSEMPQIESFEEDKISTRASQEGSVESFENLIPEPHPSLSRPSLHRAISARHESVTRLLLQHGADPGKRDGNGLTALHLAVQSGQESLVKLLLENKVDPNLQDALGRTALFSAVQCENEAVIKLLLESSINVNRKDTFGEIALHVAVEKASENIIGMLLSYGADIDA